MVAAWVPLLAVNRTGPVKVLPVPLRLRVIAPWPPLAALMPPLPRTLPVTVKLLLLLQMVTWLLLFSVMLPLVVCAAKV
jgi:hypothetical protein